MAAINLAVTSVREKQQESEGWAYEGLVCVVIWKPINTELVKTEEAFKNTQAASHSLMIFFFSILFLLVFWNSD